MTEELKTAKHRLEELGWYWQTNVSLHRVEFLKGDMILTCNKKEVCCYRRTKDGAMWDVPIIDTHFGRKSMIDELTGEHWSPHCGATPDDLRAIADLMEAAEKAGSEA